ncbi:hypothetical protein DL95DRAFT_347196 [Leptodontidium sp. 2 PMI_412]|nr:hypothetical protein DL95DRAFT_347196 [Leptodontidium sp. 2 PMI_412]
MSRPMEGKPEAIKELREDLARKYHIHGTKVEQLWRSFDRGQRAKALKAGAAEGVVLKDPRDRSMGNVYKIIPEMNLRDLVEPAEYLLDILKYRATKSLAEQYAEGPNGGPGDSAVILNSMRMYNLRHVDEFKYSFTMFIDDDQYGQSYKASNRARYEETMRGLSAAVDAGVCHPQSTGELILERQLYTLQTLNVLIEDILDVGSTSRDTKARPKKPEEAAQAALSKLSIVPKPEKSLEDLLASAVDQKASLDEYLNLCRTEPVFFAHMVNLWFFSRPELVQDEKGRIMPLVTDKYISIAVYEMLHNAIAGAATWGYICQLLQVLIESPEDPIRRATVLQEMSNVCHMEYGRVQKLFKRHVQTGSGSKHFRRVYGVYDNGVARVTMKGKPELLTRDNPQLHYMLRLCQTETDASKSVAWIKKLDDLHQLHPSEREDMQEREFESFRDIAVIAGFVQSFSTMLPLPSINTKKGRIYVSKSNELAAELDPLKTDINLSDFAIPIDNLLEPGMAAGALNALDKFIVDKTGTKMGFLYQDLINICVSDIQEFFLQPKTTAEFVPLTPFVETPTPELRVQQRRQKDKTRPAHSYIYDIAPPPPPPTQPETQSPPPAFKVKPKTVEVFSTLFSKSEARGSITWVSFEAAMADLKFSVIPKFGSVFTFCPPQDMGVQKSLTLHRPHKARIEGHLLLIFATRLKSVYGWGEECFEVAEGK